MGKRLKISERTKAKIKAGFSKIKKSSLKGDSLRYYNLIRAGKARAKAPRFKGQFLSGKMVEMVEKIAKQKGVSVKKYLDENKLAVNALIESGYTGTFKPVDAAIDIVTAYKGRYILVYDGDGIVKLKKSETILRLAEFQMFVFSTTLVVMLATFVRVYESGKLGLCVPADYDQYEGTEMIAYLDLFPDDIFYIISDPNAKKKK